MFKNFYGALFYQNYGTTANLAGHIHYPHYPDPIRQVRKALIREATMKLVELQKAIAQVEVAVDRVNRNQVGLEENQGKGNC